MQTPLLFLNIDEGDIALILFYVFIHPLSIVLFLITLLSKGKIYLVSQITLLIQLIMSLIVLISFFNPVSLVSIIASGMMIFFLFKQKRKINLIGNNK
jgi:hypothetical protein